MTGPVEFPPGAFRRIDEEDDARFYVIPRKVVHIVSFSNRCFPDKAVALWRAANDEQHMKIVAAYFRASGGWDSLSGDAHTTRGGDPLYAVWALKPSR